mmetsp:Transcript_20502/g.57412  ORF Transcript_20502/g.57412 Transcript_20502/m.57412 type:complete len:324 (-) Transcript_20502:1664-2635(-)
MRAPAISHSDVRSGCSSVPSSSSSSSAPSSSSAGFPPAFASSPRRSNDSFSSLTVSWQRCLTCSAARMPGPAFRRQVVTPSALVLKAMTSTSAESNAGRTRFRNSMTRSPTVCVWPSCRAQWQSWPHVSKARSLMSSAEGKSKTGSSAWAVCATCGAYDLPSSSTNVWTHSSAPFKSCISDDRIIRTSTFPSLDMSVRLISSPSSRSFEALVSNSVGASVNLARTPGRMCDKNGRKSSFMVEQIRSEADITYSLTGSSSGRFGTCVAWIMACMMISASVRNPLRPTAFASSDMHSKHFPRRVRSSTLWRMFSIMLLSIGISCP